MSNWSNIHIPDGLQFLGEKFTPGMAWIDLQMLGETNLSVRQLAARWKWTKSSVQRFLKRLSDELFVGQEMGQNVGQVTPQTSGIYKDDRDSKWDSERDTKEDPLDGPSPNPTLPFPPTPPITYTPVTTPPIIPQETLTKKTGAKRFVPPTVDEVREYCESRNNGIDPEAFVDFYQVNGWVQGKQGKPIKDWKACVRTWERNGNNYGRKQQKQNGSTMDQYQQAMLEIDKEYGLYSGTDTIDEQ